MSILDLATHAPPPVAPWRLMTKFVYFLALAAAIGGTWTAMTVVRPALRRASTITGADAVLLRQRAARLAALGTTALLVVAPFQLASRISAADKVHPKPFAEAFDLGAMRTYLTKPAKSGEWIASNTLHLTQNVLIVAAAVVLLPLVWRSTRARDDARVTAAAFLTVAASLVASVPTKAPTWDAGLHKLLIQGHIVGGSLWVGGLLFLGALAATRKHLDVTAGDAWRTIWQRFGVLALVSVGMVLVSGVWLTWKTVGEPSQLITTTFGRFLLVKLALVTGLVAAGAYNQLVLMPKIARAQRAGGTANVFALTLRHFPRVVVTEIVLGIGVLGVVPFLTGDARSQAGGAEAGLVDGRILLLGLLLVATLIGSFVITVCASEALGNRREASPVTTANDLTTSSVAAAEERGIATN